MLVVNPYLNFNGNTEEAFNFYKSVFGGEFAVVMRFKDGPEASKLPEEDQNKLMHIALPLGPGNMLMGTDALESAMGLVTMGSNFSLTISCESKEEADKFHAGLSVDQQKGGPMREEFWGDYFGWVTDKFGISWMISFNPNRP
ncbi:VOC family protein [Mucilaginibacter celer]|uniref:VOC family protein n=1 Tax=Mucilaginibacter celer TaxID=2305508 RepID=A0A494VXX3_9SPHI|nr:VOC family protein [Mucilaginibacter celer]AYL95842.1 VOC family protein [Mucilaginibacter celer]